MESVLRNSLPTSSGPGGIESRQRPRTGDYGVDLILEKNGQKAVVQVKWWKGRVGVTAIQEIYAGKPHYGAYIAMVVSNSWFTDEARRLARSTVSQPKYDFPISVNAKWYSPFTF